MEMYPRIVNFLIENNISVQFDEDTDDDLIYDITEYIDDLIEYEYKFNGEEAAAVMYEITENEEIATSKSAELLKYLEKDHDNEVLKSVIEDALYELSKYRWDKRVYMIENILGDGCDCIDEHLELAKFIWEDIKDDEEFEEKYDGCYYKLAAKFDKNYWLKRLAEESLSSGTFEEHIDEILEADTDDLVKHANKIAEYIYWVGDGCYNQRDKQLRILEKIHEKDEELLQAVLESDNLMYWDAERYFGNSMVKQIENEDRRNNRISVKEANEIIEQNGLSDILEAKEGYVGLEDMSFDYLYDKKTSKQLAESEFDGLPWFEDRGFGDKQMSRDWFLEAMEKYLLKIYE